MCGKINLSEREKKEIEFWQQSPIENPSQFSPENLKNKLREAVVFKYKINRYRQIFQQSQRILEIGAGQGWASCILKRKFPSKVIIASDIAKYAIQSVKYWEEFYKIKIDKCLTCKSYQLSFRDNSLDLVFCFSSAHHFGKISETLKEIYRVLKPTGVCLFLHEPSCRKFLYKIAHWRVNRKRPPVWEDVLLYQELVKLGYSAGFKVSKANFDPTSLNRRPIEKIYYTILAKSKFLQSLLPCSADYLFEK